MSELEKLRFQVDAWTSGSEPDESRLDVLEVCKKNQSQKGMNIVEVADTLTNGRKKSKLKR